MKGFEKNICKDCNSEIIPLITKVDNNIIRETLICKNCGNAQVKHIIKK